MSIHLLSIIYAVALITGLRTLVGIWFLFWRFAEDKVTDDYFIMRMSFLAYRTPLCILTSFIIYKIGYEYFTLLETDIFVAWIIAVFFIDGCLWVIIRILLDEAKSEINDFFFVKLFVFFSICSTLLFFLFTHLYPSPTITVSNNCDDEITEIEKIKCNISQLETLKENLVTKQRNIKSTLNDFKYRLRSSKSEYTRLKIKHDISTLEQAQQNAEVHNSLLSIKRKVAYIDYLKTIAEKVNNSIVESNALIEKANDDILIINTLQGKDIKKLLRDLKTVIGANHDIDDLAIDKTKVPNIPLEKVFNENE